MSTCEVHDVRGPYGKHCAHVGAAHKCNGTWIQGLPLSVLLLLANTQEGANTMQGLSLRRTISCEQMKPRNTPGCAGLPRLATVRQTQTTGLLCLPTPVGGLGCLRSSNQQYGLLQSLLHLGCISVKRKAGIHPRHCGTTYVSEVIEKLHGVLHATEAIQTPEKCSLCMTIPLRGWVCFTEGMV